MASFSLLKFPPWLVSSWQDNYNKDQNLSGSGFRTVSFHVSFTLLRLGLPSSLRHHSPWLSAPSGPVISWPSSLKHPPHPSSFLICSFGQKEYIRFLTENIFISFLNFIYDLHTLCMCVHLHLWRQRSEEHMKSLGAEVEAFVGCPCMCWDPALGLWEQQTVLMPPPPNHLSGVTVVFVKNLKMIP